VEPTAATKHPREIHLNGTAPKTAEPEAARLPARSRRSAPAPETTPRPAKKKMKGLHPGSADHHRDPRVLAVSASVGYFLNSRNYVTRQRPVDVTNQHQRPHRHDWSIRVSRGAGQAEHDHGAGQDQAACTAQMTIKSPGNGRWRSNALRGSGSPRHQLARYTSQDLRHAGWTRPLSGVHLGRAGGHLRRCLLGDPVERRGDQVQGARQPFSLFPGVQQHRKLPEGHQ